MGKILREKRKKIIIVFLHFWLTKRHGQRQAEGGHSDRLRDGGGVGARRAQGTGSPVARHQLQVPVRGKRRRPLESGAFILTK